MRPFELALVLSCFPTLILGALGWRVPAPAAIAFAALPAAMAGIQAALEGPRLLMGPADLAAAAIALQGLAKLLPEKSRLPPWTDALAACAVIILLLAAVALAWAFPAFSLPRPPGQHAVGTTAITWEAPGRQDISLKAWYPARKGRERAAYLTGTADARSFPSVRFAKTNAFQDAEPAPAPKGGWPLILYSPSWDGALFENTALCEGLASEGFIVIAAARPNAGQNPPRLDFTSEESLARFLKAAEAELELRTDSLLAVFAQLAELQSGKLAGGRFRNLLNTRAVGAMGYSFGGAVAAEACRREPGLRCGMDLDGTLFGAAASKGAFQPFLFVTDTAPAPSESERRTADPIARRNAEFYAKSFLDMDRWLQTHGGWLVRIDGVQHANFSDRPLYSPLRRFTGAGQRNARETLSLITTCATAFFNTFLRQANTSAAWEQTPGVDVRKFPNPSDPPSN